MAPKGSERNCEHNDDECAPANDARMSVIDEAVPEREEFALALGVDHDAQSAIGDRMGELHAALAFARDEHVGQRRIHFPCDDRIEQFTETLELLNHRLHFHASFGFGPELPCVSGVFALRVLRHKRWADENADAQRRGRGLGHLCGGRGGIGLPRRRSA